MNNGGQVIYCSKNKFDSDDLKNSWFPNHDWWKISPEKEKELKEKGTTTFEFSECTVTTIEVTDLQHENKRQEN